MSKYTVSVPPTRDVGSFRVSASSSLYETAAQNALWSYNSAREHDGLEPLKRMPKGTTYKRLPATRDLTDSNSSL